LPLEQKSTGIRLQRYSIVDTSTAQAPAAQYGAFATKHLRQYMPVK
jgi:hypothetical protein